MAQTTTYDNRAGFKIEVSVDASAWTDISGQANTVTPSGGEQMTGSLHTADGSAAIVTGSNKTEPITLTCSCVYTETAAQGWRIVADRFQGAAKTIAVRYSPRGGAQTERRFVTSNDAGTAIIVPIVNCLPPEGDADSGDPLVFEFSVIAPKLVEEAVP